MRDTSKIPMNCKYILHIHTNSVYKTSFYDGFKEWQLDIPAKICTRRYTQARLMKILIKFMDLNFIKIFMAKIEGEM